MGKNIISKWTQISAVAIGLYTKKIKITNNLNRASTVSELAKAEVSDQQLIKLIGHSNSNSSKPYLQMNATHHKEIVSNLRNNMKIACQSNNENNILNAIVTNFIEENNTLELSSTSRNIYNNCSFTNCSFKLI